MNKEHLATLSYNEIEFEAILFAERKKALL